MGLRINTNVASINSQRQLHQSGDAMKKSLARLSSGQRITNAGDDAAGLSIGTNLEAQIRGIRQATRNANDGIGMVQTAEGGLNEVSNILIRLRELSVQAATDTLSDVERTFLDKEVQQLKSEVDRIAESTNFNGEKLLNGEADDGALHFHVGYFSGEENVISYNTENTVVKTESLGVDGVDIKNREASLDSMGMIDGAIQNVNAMRADLGALQNRLQSSVRSLRITDENMSDARSRIMDTDVAAETAELTKNNILQQAGVAVLAQANTQPKLALNLL